MSWGVNPSTPSIYIPSHRVSSTNICGYGLGMASPDWQEIFTRRPDLNPPGHDEVINDMRNNPWRYSKRKNVAPDTAQGSTRSISF